MPVGDMMHLLSGVIVVAFGLFLVGLALVVALARAVAERFLRACACW